VGIPEMDKKKKESPTPHRVLNSAWNRGNKLTNFYIDKNIFLKIVAFKETIRKTLNT
jgi:hypothetical protein